MPPKNLRLVDKRVLTLSDLKFSGFYRYPASAGEMFYSAAGFTKRTVNGKLRLLGNGGFTEGDYPLLEFELPAAEPHADMNVAPALSLVRNWGFYRTGHIVTNNSGNPNYPGGIFFDESRNTLWWSYADTYVPVQHYPSFGATVLNDASGTVQSYGPWRTEWSPQRTVGSICEIPSWFAEAHTGGTRIAVSAFPTSGAAGSPWGACLSATGFPNPVTTPPDPFSNTSVRSIRNKGLLLHDLDHRQTRDTNYKLCGWNVRDDNSRGGTLERGIALFGSQEPGANTYDSLGPHLWIDLPDKHGILCFGILAGTPPGDVAPHDPDGLVHIWYGPGQCIHGQDDPFHMGNGPGTNYRIAKGWIYDPSDLIDTAAGRRNLSGVKPVVDAFDFSALSPAFNRRLPSGMWGVNPVFEPATRRIYIQFFSFSSPRAIAVFEIA